MSQVLEVSEGVGTQSRVFETPLANQDNEQPRYLTFIGSLVDPETASSRPWTKGGGIEVSNPCLRYVKSFIRKGRITPLLKDTHDFIPYDLARKTVGDNPLGAGYFAQPIPKGYVPPNLPPSSGEFQPGFGNVAVGGPSPYGSLVGRLALPGEQINSILTGSENITHTNVRRGIVELTSLAGKPYRPEEIGGMYVDRDVLGMQKAIFPSYPTLPVLLDELEQDLDAAAQHTALREIVDIMHESLIQFRDYANATIQNTHHYMRESAGRRGYVFRYTSMDLVLLEQLGMDRQDREIRAAATATGGSNPKLESMFEQWLAISLEEKQANLERLKRTGDVNENTMAAAPINEGYSGYGGQSGYSGFSGEIVADAVEHEVVASSVDDPLPNPVIAPIDLTGERPSHIHHKTWEKMQREAAAKTEE